MSWQFHFAVLLVTLVILIWLPLLPMIALALAAILGSIWLNRKT